MDNLSLLVITRWFNELCRIGVFHNGTTPIGYTCEDTDRNLTSDMPLAEIEKIKVWGKTGIPYGRYRVFISFSEHFKRNMPFLVGVPGWKGVLIHKGNRPQDTEGCILIGKNMTLDGVYDCEALFEEIFALIEQTI